MATLVIPTPDDLKAFSLQVQLDGATFTIRLIWNVRDSEWYLDLYDSSQEPVISGHRLVANSLVLLNCVRENRPLGELMALSTQDDLDPGLNDLGNRVTLLYQEAP